MSNKNDLLNFVENKRKLVDITTIQLSNESSWVTTVVDDLVEKLDNYTTEAIVQGLNVTDCKIFIQELRQSGNVILRNISSVVEVYKANQTDYLSDANMNAFLESAGDFTKFYSRAEQCTASESSSECFETLANDITNKTADNDTYFLAGILLISGGVEFSLDSVNMDVVETLLNGNHAMHEVFDAAKDCYRNAGLNITDVSM